MTQELVSFGRDVISSLMLHSLDSFESTSLTSALSTSSKMMTSISLSLSDTKTKTKNKNYYLMRDILSITKNLTSKLSSSELIVGEKRGLDLGNNLHAYFIKFTKSSSSSSSSVLNLTYNNMSLSLPRSPWANLSETDVISLVTTMFPSNPYTFNAKQVQSLVVSVIFEVNGVYFKVEKLGYSDQMEFLLPSHFDASELEFDESLPGLKPSCSFWDESSNGWSDHGCRRSNFSEKFVKCRCSHATDFGSFTSYFVPEINWLKPDDFANITKLNPDNMTVLVVLLAMTLIYLFVLVMIQMCQCCCNVAECNVGFWCLGAKEILVRMIEVREREKVAAEKVASESEKNDEELKELKDFSIGEDMEDDNLEYVCETKNEFEIVSVEEHGDTCMSQSHMEELEEGGETVNVIVQEETDKTEVNEDCKMTVEEERMDQNEEINVEEERMGEHVENVSVEEECDYTNSNNDNTCEQSIPSKKDISETKAEFQELDERDESEERESESIDVSIDMAGEETKEVEKEEKQDEYGLDECDGKIEIIEVSEDEQRDQDEHVENEMGEAVRILGVENENEEKEEEEEESLGFVKSKEHEILERSKRFIEQDEEDGNLEEEGEVVGNHENDISEQPEDFEEEGDEVNEVNDAEDSKNEKNGSSGSSNSSNTSSSSQSSEHPDTTSISEEQAAQEQEKQQKEINPPNHSDDKTESEKMTAKNKNKRNCFIQPPRYVEGLIWMFLTEHLWTSLLFKAEGEFQFTTAQRWTILYCTILGSMLANALTFGTEPRNVLQMFASMILSNIFTLPFIFFFTYIFVRTRRFALKDVLNDPICCLCCCFCCGYGKRWNRALFWEDLERWEDDESSSSAEKEELMEQLQTTQKKLGDAEARIEMLENSRNDGSVEEGGEEIQVASSSSSSCHEENIEDTDNVHVEDTDKDMKKDAVTEGNNVDKKKKLNFVQGMIHGCLCIPRCCYYHNPLSYVNRFIHTTILCFQCLTGRFVLWGLLVLFIFTILYFVVASGLCVLMYYELTWCGATGTILFAVLIVVLYMAFVEVVYLTARIRKFAKSRNDKQWNQNSFWLAIQIFVAFVINQASVICAVACFVLILALETFPIEAGVAGMVFFFSVSVLSMIYIIFTLKRPKKQRQKNEETKGRKILKTFIKLPFYFKYVAYFLCWAYIVSVGYVLVLYGIKFDTVGEGETKQTAKWLTGSGLSSIEDIFIQEPIEIIFKTLVVASVMRLFELAFFSALSRGNGRKKKKKRMKRIRKKV